MNMTKKAEIDLNKLKQIDRYEHRETDRNRQIARQIQTHCDRQVDRNKQINMNKRRENNRWQDWSIQKVKRKKSNKINRGLIWRFELKTCGFENGAV